MARFRLSALCLLGWVAGSAAVAQTSPSDLAELSLAELIDVRVMPEAVDVGRWQVGYRFLEKDFEGYLVGTDALSFDQMLELYPVVPTEIHQQAHLVDISYRLSSAWRLDAVLPFIEQSTDHIRRVGPDFTISTRGFGDMRLSATRKLPALAGARSTTLDLGLGVPTGSIDEKGDTPRGRNTQVPYTMQTGSGTWSFEPALSLAGGQGSVFWNARARAVLRLGRNDRDYSLGDRLVLTFQLSGPPERRVVPQIRMKTEIWKSIDGADTEIDPAIAPVADAALFGGERIDLVAGVEIRIGNLGSFRINGGAPVYQSLNGPQPKRRRQVSLGWKSRWF